MVHLRPCELHALPKASCGTSYLLDMRIAPVLCLTALGTNLPPAPALQHRDTTACG